MPSRLALAVLMLLAAGEAMAGSISGRITSDSGGGPIEGARTYLCRSLGNCPDNVLTGADGGYRFDGLAAGTYFVLAVKSPHISEYYDGAQCPCDPRWSNPTPIAVTASGETSGIDLSLTLGGTISGNVLSASTGKGVHNVQMVVEGPNGWAITFSLFSGEFRAGPLPPGEYRVYTLAKDLLHVVNQVYPLQHCVTGANCSSAEIRAGNTVAVTAGNDTPGIHFNLADWATISGTIRRADGSPLAFKWLTFVDAANNQKYDQQTGANGAYIRAMPPGSYTVSVSGGANYSAATHPVPVQLTTTSVTGIDLTVPSTVARIEGTVRDRKGAPFANVEVRVILPTGSYTSKQAMTDAAGRYVIDDIMPGRHYVKALDELHPRIDCPSTCNVQGGTPFDLTAGTTTTVDMQLLSEKSVFTGRATRAGGTPVKLDSVAFFGDVAHQFPGSTIFQSKADGTYTLTFISRANTINLRAYAQDLVPTAHPNVPVACAWDAWCPVAGAVAVSAGTRGGIDFVLSPYGAISGTITDKSTGAPLAFVPVNIVQNGTSAGSAQSDAQGRYRWAKAFGAYKLYVPEPLGSAAWSAGQVYPGRDCTGRCDLSLGSTVNVGIGGETTGIDFQLHSSVRHARITGVARDAVTREPLGGVPVRFAQNGVDVATVTTNAAGAYQWTLANGSYHVYIPGDSTHRGQVYPSRNCTGTCDSRIGNLVVAQDGAEKNGIDFNLEKVLPSETGRITGRVLDHETGEGVPNAVVRAWSSTFSAQVVSDFRGAYTIEKNGANEPIPPGSYRVTAELLPYYLSVYGGLHCPDSAKCNENSGAPVTVTASAATTGIDFRLVRVHAAGVSPAAGPEAGGTWITISGKNFTAGTKVLIGGAEAEIVSVTPESIVAITPPGDAGPADVTISVSSTRGVTISDGFTYTAGSSRRRSARH